MSKTNKLGKVKKSPTLEQTTVVAPIGPPDAPYGYDENGNKIQPPKDDHTRHKELLKTKQIETARCVKHPEYPSADCYKCKEEADQKQARVAAATAPPPILKPVDPPDPRQKDIEHARKVLGVPAAPKSLVRAIPLTSTAAPWSSTNPTDITKYDAELLERAKREERRNKSTKVDGLLKPTKPAAITWADMSFRKILHLSREQIASWLTMPEILYKNPPIERILRNPTIEEFEQQRADKIKAIEQRIAEDKHEIAEIEARRGTSGLNAYEIAGLKTRLRNRIKKAEKEITAAKRLRPPKNTGKPAMIEKEFSGPRLNPDIVAIYLKTWQKATDDSDAHREFENVVITQACKQSLISGTDIAKHPELKMLDLETTERCVSADRQEEHHAEADSRASGLSVHGRGRATLGDVWVNRELKTFDGVYRIRQAGNDEDNSVASRTDAPDYDPPDDSA